MRGDSRVHHAFDNRSWKCANIFKSRPSNEITFGDNSSSRRIRKSLRVLRGLRKIKDDGFGCLIKLLHVSVGRRHGAALLWFRSSFVMRHEMFIGIVLHWRFAVRLENFATRRLISNSNDLRSETKEEDVEIEKKSRSESFHQVRLSFKNVYLQVGLQYSSIFTLFDGQDSRLVNITILFVVQVTYVRKWNGNFKVELENDDVCQSFWAIVNILELFVTHLIWQKISKKTSCSSLENFCNIKSRKWDSQFTFFRIYYFYWI